MAHFVIFTLAVEIQELFLTFHLENIYKSNALYFSLCISGICNPKSTFLLSGESNK